MNIRNIYILLLIGFSLIACTSDDEYTNIRKKSDVAILFSAKNGEKEVTRGNISALSNIIQSFYIYGYKNVNGTLQTVMPRYTINWHDESMNTSINNSSGWSYVGEGTDLQNNAQEIKYWDGNASEYRFFGILTPQNTNLKYNGNNVTASTAPTSEGEFTLEMADISYLTIDKDGKYYQGNSNTEVDANDIPMYGKLWAATPASTPDVVTLEFVRPYAFVRVAFMRAEKSNTVIIGDDTDVSHTTTFAPVSGSMSTTGSATITYPLSGNSEESLTMGATSGALTSLSFDEATLSEEGVPIINYPIYAMIPTGTTPYDDFKLGAYVNSEGSIEYREAIVPAAYMQWKPGYQYTYIFKVTNTALEFNSTIEVYDKWKEGYVEYTNW